MVLNTVKFPYGTVICGDVLDPNLFRKYQLESSGYPLVIADPPYGQILKNTNWDNWTSEEYLHLSEVIKNLLSYGGSAYVWGGIGKRGNRPFFEFLASVENHSGLNLKNVITWKKRRAYGKSDDYLFTREEIAWLVKGEKPAVFNVPYLDEKRGYAGYSSKYPAKSEYKRRTNVWTDVTEILRGKKHIAEKPERLAEVMIETHTKPGDVVVDLLSGSGNVSVVAKRMGRRFIAVEGDRETFESILQRLR